MSQAGQNHSSLPCWISFPPCSLIAITQDVSVMLAQRVVPLQAPKPMGRNPCWAQQPRKITSSPFPASNLLVVDVCSGVAISAFDRVLHVAVGLLYFPFAFVQDTF